MSKTRCPRHRGGKDDLDRETAPRRPAKQERWKWDGIDPADLDNPDATNEDFDLEIDDELVDLLAEDLSLDEFFNDDEDRFDKREMPRWLRKQ
jgi:hypothetical protein